MPMVWREREGGEDTMQGHFVDVERDRGYARVQEILERNKLNHFWAASISRQDWEQTGRTCGEYK